MIEYMNNVAMTEEQATRVLREIGTFTRPIPTARKGDAEICVRKVHSTLGSVAVNCFLPADDAAGNNWSMLACIVDRNGKVQGEDD